ncbi:MAG: hypothetical protein ACI9HE_001049 [Planctomycetota bacterium]|jgi:hypothetical protein
MTLASNSATEPAWWQRPFDHTTLLIVALPSGAILWSAIQPSFYYMTFVFILTFYWLGISSFLVARATLAEFGSRLSGRPVRWSGWRLVLGLMSAVTLAILTKAPLYAGFALARADLDWAIANDMEPGESFHLARSNYGPYPMYQLAERSCHNKDRVYFNLSADTEAAFIYSTSGIDELCYNSGSKGHLGGNWYWMAED